MSFCANCGSQLEADVRFCRACGAPVGAAQSVTSQPIQVQASEQPHTAYEVTSYRPSSPPPGVPTGDYVRDALAAAALIASLFMVWRNTAEDGIFGNSGGSIAATHIDVTLATLVSVVSIGIPYLWRAGVFGTNWTYAKTQTARLLANAPYIILTVVYLVIELIDHKGIGPAMAFGLAGAVLAAQPRAAEINTGDDVHDRRWIGIVIGLAAMVAVLTVVQIGVILMQPGSFSSYGGHLITAIILAMASVAILATVAVRVANLDNSWRLAGVGIGIFAAVFGLLSLSPQVSLITTNFNGAIPSCSLTFWVAFGVAVAAPSIARLTGGQSAGFTSWLAGVRAVLNLAISVTALVAVISIIELMVAATSSADSYLVINQVPRVVALFFGVISVVGGVVARAMLANGTRQGPVVVTAYAALLFMLGLILVILWSTQTLGGIAPLTLVVAFGLPLGLIALLWGPASMRQQFAATAPAEYPAMQVSSAVRSVATAVVAPPPHAQSTLNTNPLVVEAADPATTGARLRELASTVPESRAAIAGNTSTYPALREWLGSLGQPDVDAALQHRKLLGQTGTNQLS